MIEKQYRLKCNHCGDLTDWKQSEQEALNQAYTLDWSVWSGHYLGIGNFCYCSNCKDAEQEKIKSCNSSGIAMFRREQRI